MSVTGSLESSVEDHCNHAPGLAIVCQEEESSSLSIQLGLQVRLGKDP